MLQLNGVEKSGAPMPSNPRQPSESGIYHVLSRGVGRSILFEDERDRTTYVTTLAEHVTDLEVTTYAWCLMDNHVHLLLRAEMKRLSKLMRTVNSSYTMYFNGRHDRPGHLFQRRFKSEPVETDEYFLTVLRYIHQNPLKAGIAESCGYRWSSWADYQTDGEETPLSVDTSMALDMLGGRDALVAFFNERDSAPGCLDVGRGRKAVSDEEAIAVAKEALGPISLGRVKGLARDRRNQMLRTLRESGLSIRQIERLTGVSRNVVQRCG